MRTPIPYPARRRARNRFRLVRVSQPVHITRTGKKYHSDGCRYLAASKIAISLKDAKAKGYTACKVCHPPE